MLAALPIPAIAVPLERSSEAIHQDVGKRQAACGGWISVAFSSDLARYDLPLVISLDDEKKSTDNNATSRTIRVAAACAWFVSGVCNGESYALISIETGWLI